MLLQGCFAAEDTATLFTLVSEQTFSVEREWLRCRREGGCFCRCGVGRPPVRVPAGSWGRGAVGGTGTGTRLSEGWPMLSCDKTRTGEPFRSCVCNSFIVWFIYSYINIYIFIVNFPKCLTFNMVHYLFSSTCPTFS